MLHFEVLDGEFTVCKPENPADIRLSPFCFLAITDREFSLVCPTPQVPERAFMECLHLTDRKSTRLNSSHYQQSRMPSSA